MITIKYEIYRNDYDRTVNLEKSFDSLDDFGKWLLDFATPYSPTDKHSYLYVWDKWSEHRYEKYGELPGNLSSRNYDDDRDIWVYLVQNEDGVIYSSGKYTGDVQHISKDMVSFLRDLQSKYEHPVYKFVD